jgi:hypothetical protein
LKSLNDTFQERAARAAEAKQKALDRLKAKPQLSPEALAERQAASLARETKQAEQRAAKQAAREQAAADKAAAVAAAKAAAEVPVRSEADAKAARDARYAARKGRTKK